MTLTGDAGGSTTAAPSAARVGASDEASPEASEELPWGTPVDGPSPSAARGGGPDAVRRRRALAQELAGDDAALEEEAGAVGGEMLEFLHRSTLQRLDRLHRAPNASEHRRPVIHAGAGAEGEALEIPGQPHPGGEHDVGVLAGGVEPVESRVGDPGRQIAHGATFRRVRI
jgi:hypothetical protein